jgi:hypothetical protein
MLAVSPAFLLATRGADIRGATPLAYLLNVLVRPLALDIRYSSTNALNRPIAASHCSEI